MSHIQYTIRDVPKPLDGFLRQQAKRQQKSLNRLVLEYIEQATKVDRQAAKVEDDLSWFIGANTMDEATLRAIAQHRQDDIDKRYA